MGKKLSIAELQHIIETEGQGVVDMLPDGTVRRRTPEEFQQFQKEEAERKCQAAATPRRHLIKELLDPRVSKTEREHVAVRLIGELASRLETTKTERKLLRQGKGWAEERAADAERDLKAARNEMAAQKEDIETATVAAMEQEQVREGLYDELEAARSGADGCHLRNADEGRCECPAFPSESETGGE